MGDHPTTARDLNTRRTWRPASLSAPPRGSPTPPNATRRIAPVSWRGQDTERRRRDHCGFGLPGRL